MENEIIALEPYLLRRATYLTRNSFEAKDLLQEVFLKAIKHKKSFTPGTSLKNWMLTILRNTFINEYRKRKRVKIYDIEECKLPIRKVRTESEAEFNLLNEELGSIVKTLAQSDQKLLRYLSEGYKYREIASELNMPIGTLKSRIFNLRKKLRRKYGEK